MTNKVRFGQILYNETGGSTWFERDLEAEPVMNNWGLDLYKNKCKALDGEFHDLISEGSTGMILLSRMHTPEELDKEIERRGIDNIRDKVNRVLKIYGLSPRYKRVGGSSGN